MKKVVLFFVVTSFLFGSKMTPDKGNIIELIIGDDQPALLFKAEDPSINQQYFEFGTGTATNAQYAYPAPYGNYYRNCRHQILILASEFEAHGITPGTRILSLGFYQTALNNVGSRPCTVKLKEVTYSRVGTTFDNVGLTTVYGVSTFTPTTGWTEHTFTTPYTWNGQNLLIDIFYGDLAIPYTKNASTRYTVTTDTLCSFYRSDVTPAYNYTGPVTGRGRTRPNVRLKVEVTLDYNVGIIEVFSPDIFGRTTLDYAKNNTVGVVIHNTGQYSVSYKVNLNFTDTLGNNLVLTSPSYSTSPNDTDTVMVTIPRNTLSRGFYTVYAFLSDFDPQDQSSADNQSGTGWFVSVRNEGVNPQIFVVDIDGDAFNYLDYTTIRYRDGYRMALIWNERNYTVSYWAMVLPSPTYYNPNVYAIFHGMFPNLVTLPTALVSACETYLNNGGKAVCVGGDIFAFPYIWQGYGTDMAKWDSLFGIFSGTTQDGTGDLDTILGLSSTLMPEINGRYYYYPPHNLPAVENAWVDRFFDLADIQDRVEEFFLRKVGTRTSTVLYYCGAVTHNSTTQAKTIALSFELFNTSEITTNLYIDFWDYLLREGVDEAPVLVSETITPPQRDITLKILGGSRVLLNLPKNLTFTLEIYDIQGRKLNSLNMTKESGIHEIDMKNFNLKPGAYIVRITTDSKTLGAPFVILQ